MSVVCPKFNEVCGGLTAHYSQVHLPADIAALENLAGNIEIERIGADNSTLQNAVGTLLATVVCEHVCTQRKPQTKKGSVRELFLQPFYCLGSMSAKLLLLESQGKYLPDGYPMLLARCIALLDIISIYAFIELLSGTHRS